MKSFQLNFMGKNRNWIFGFYFLLGGVILVIFMGGLLIDLLSKTILYFMLIFFIILMLYGVILMLIGILIMPVSVRLRKSVALIILLISVLIIFLSITVIIIDSFTIVNIFEILSGIGLIFLGIRLFLHPKLKEKGIKKGKKILGIAFFIIGLIISLFFGFPLIMLIFLSNFEYFLSVFPFQLLPFLSGVIILIYGKYTIKSTLTTKERKNKGLFSISIGIIIIITSIFAVYSILPVQSFHYRFYTPYFPSFFFIIGTALILYGFLLRKNTRKRSPDN